MDNFGGGSGSVLPTIRRPIRTGCRRLLLVRVSRETADARCSLAGAGRGPDRGNGYITAILTTPLPRSGGTSGSPRRSGGFRGLVASSSLAPDERVIGRAPAGVPRSAVRAASSLALGAVLPGGRWLAARSVSRETGRRPTRARLRYEAAGEALSPRGVEPLAGVESSGLPCAAARWDGSSSLHGLSAARACHARHDGGDRRAARCLRFAGRRPLLRLTTPGKGGPAPRCGPSD